MSHTAEDITNVPTKLKAHRGPHIPAEGENGLFTESWFAICPSYEVKPGAIVGKDFLDGRVVVYRDKSGTAHVLSAYCCHVGADLTVGQVVDDNIQCAFHHWQFDREGQCVKTGIGDPPPKGAGIYKFQTIEKFGLIWVFNGEEPWWQLPDFEVPESELSIDVRYDVPTMPVDPWVICANTPDWPHFKFVHKIEFDDSDPYSGYDIDDYSLRYTLKGRTDNGKGMEVCMHAGIYGTSMFCFQGVLDDQWYALMSAFGMPRPGVTQNYFAICVKKGDGSPEQQQKNKQLQDFLFRLGKAFTGMDRPILHGIKFRPGYMTEADRALANYFDIVRKFPRSHPSGDFIK